MNKNTTVKSRQSRTLPSFLDVASWEARRCWASPSTWRIVVIAFGLFLLLIWLVRYPGAVGYSTGNTSSTFHVSGGSAWGAVGMLFPFSFLLAIVLPFLNNSGVAHDVKSRTHELLMTMPVSARAYVLGRYLFYLLASLGLALLLLATLLLTSVLFHLTEQGYPLPQVNALVVLWLVAIFPTTILLSSVSFTLGTLLPRYANLTVMVPIVGWLLLFVALILMPPSVTSRNSDPTDISSSGSPFVYDKQVSPSLYQLWEPTNIGMEEELNLFYVNKLDSIVNPSPLRGDQVNSQHIVADLQALEQKLPDTLPWLFPHLVLAGIGLGFVLNVACSFNRFRTVLN